MVRPRKDSAAGDRVRGHRFVDELGRIMAPGAICLALLLAACGGGAAPVVQNPNPALQPPSPGPLPPQFDTTEFRRNWGVGALGALAAYDDGLSGEGVTVAVVDSGVDTDHFDLDANIDPRSTNIETGNAADRDDVDGHGTFVAGIIAAERNGIDMHGVAFGANILSLRTDESGTCPDDCEFFDHVIADAIDFAIDAGVRLINLSLGSEEPVTGRLTEAMRAATQAGAIIVVSAGNESAAAFINGIARVAADAGVNGQIIVAGAMNEMDVLADFSNFAGTELEDFFLAAPGVEVITTGLDDSLFVVSGTSFAAPHVTGAIALLLEKFPNLTASEIIDILYTSADDLGEVGVDAVFGRGKINLAAALQPIGPASLPMGASVVDGSMDAAASGMSLGSAFGDALTSAGLLTESIILDSFGRAFVFDLRKLIARPRAGPDLAARALVMARRHSFASALAAGQQIDFSFTGEGGMAGSGKRGEGGGWFDVLRPQPRNLSFAYTALLGRDLEFSVSGGGAGFPGLLDRRGQGPAGSLLSRGALTSPFADVLGEKAGVAVKYHLGARTEARFATSWGGGHGAPGAIGHRLEVNSDLKSGVRWGIALGTIAERDGFLGATARGAFAAIGTATTRFVGLSASLPVAAKWRLFGHLTRGLTRVDGDGGGLIRDFSAIRTGSFAVGAIASGLFAERDWLAATLSQPLRVAAASAVFDIPVGRDFDSDAILRRVERIDLEPSGRELDLELAYRVAASGGVSLEANLLYQIDPGHAAGAQDALSLFLALRTSF